MATRACTFNEDSITFRDDSTLQHTSFCHPPSQIVGERHRQLLSVDDCWPWLVVDNRSKPTVLSDLLLYGEHSQAFTIVVSHVLSHFATQESTIWCEDETSTIMSSRTPRSRDYQCSNSCCFIITVDRRRLSFFIVGPAFDSISSAASNVLD